MKVQKCDSRGNEIYAIRFCHQKQPLVWRATRRELAWNQIQTLKECHCYHMYGPLHTNLFTSSVNVSDEGYRDSARLLGESCTQKIEGRSVEKNCPKSRNNCKVNEQGCGCMGTQGPNVPNPRTNTNVQRMFLLSHILRHLWTGVNAIVAASCAVSNRESR